MAQLFWIQYRARLWFQEVQRNMSATQNGPHLLYDSWVVIKGKKTKAEAIFFRTNAIPSMSWVNDTVENRTVTFENGCLTRMRIVWQSSMSFPNRRPLLVSCQVSTAPHHTTALPPRNLTQHAWKELLHKNQAQKHTLLKLYWTGL